MKLCINIEAFSLVVSDFWSSMYISIILRIKKNRWLIFEKGLFWLCALTFHLKSDDGAMQPAWADLGRQPFSFFKHVINVLLLLLSQQGQKWVQESWCLTLKYVFPFCWLNPDTNKFHYTIHLTAIRCEEQGQKHVEVNNTDSKTGIMSNKRIISTLELQCTNQTQAVWQLISIHPSNKSHCTAVSSVLGYPHNITFQCKLILSPQSHHRHPVAC